jgi:hypothetical protein
MDKANIIESIDVLKAKEQLDLQEQTRRDDVYTELNEIVDKLQSIPVFPSLLWVWTFDVIRETYQSNLTVEDWSEEIIRDGVTLKQIFDKFWDDVDDLGLSMDSGVDIIEEVIMDWMRENNFLVSLDDDGWLDD